MNNTNVRVDFNITGNDFDIQTVSEELKIVPTKTSKKGDFIRNTKNRYEYTTWMFSTGAEETLDISTQLNKLENIFYDKENILYDIKKRYNLDFCIEIIIVIENQISPAIYFNEKFIHFLSCIEARIDIDTYIN